MYAAALFILPQVLSGFRITGGVPTYIFGAMILTLMSLVVKPILNLVSFPLNLVTLGLFSAVANMLILYLLTIIVPNISIQPFLFHGFKIAGFIIPKLALNHFFAFVAAAFALSFIISFINWLNS